MWPTIHEIFIHGHLNFLAICKHFLSKEIFLHHVSVDVFQATYEAIKKVVKAASEDAVLGKYVGYTEDQVSVVH